MNFNDAVKRYQADPTDAALYAAAKALCAELTTREKLRMLSGRRFFLRNGFDLITKGQKYNCRPCLAGGVRRLGIPPVAFSDGPRGVVMGNSTCFPVSMARGASFDEALEYEIGSAIADEVTAQGGNYFAGICINLLRNPRWGRAQETYGEDPFLLGKMGAALTRAVQDKGVIACPKHYAVNSIENIRFDVNVLADEITLHEVYLPHFKACVDAGAMSVMGAYNLFRGEHCCESRYLLKDVLREQWGFTGFTISDFIFGVRSASRALKAGLDIEMPQRMRYAALPLDLKRGKVSMEDVDASVQSVLRGLIKITPKLRPAPKSAVACKAHTDLAKRAALEGTVLLKNDGALPLSPGKKIAVIGRYANQINVGDHGSSSVFAPYTVTPYEGLCRVYGRENVVLCEGTDFTAQTDAIRACDAVLLCVGSDYKQEGENLANFSKNDNVTQKATGGDRYSLRIPEEEAALIHAACAAFGRVIVNIIGGSAYIIEEWKEEAAAILHSFYGGMEGGSALAELLSGKANPCGHLPFTMAKSEEDYPDFLFPGDKTRDIAYGYYHGYTLLDKEKKKAAYPFGFGLSYTEFTYSDIEAHDRGDAAEITLNITNTGSRDGKTVVQVYAGAAGDHPVKLLKGFKKVFVKAGETVRATVGIDKDDLRFYDPAAKAWYPEKEYVFYVGQDCENVSEARTT
ncbi:MAG: glycoside hydrolase family 3 C-terminal domain-containing protein [Clostridia bacterium]|nr:glycoside hydrolase family 3 C-terminal domain-containing protein [Clostridia bacterium]